MNIFLAQSYHARNELKRIANVKLQIIHAKSSDPIIGLGKSNDGITGIYKLTDVNTKMKGWEVANLLSNTESPTKTKIEMDKTYSGHEILTHIIPDITNVSKDFQIIDGVAKSGYFGKSALAGKNSIIHFIWDKFGADYTRQFIDDAQKLSLNYLLTTGLTCGFGDCILETKIYDNIQKIISNKLLESKYNVTQFENEIEQISPEVVENSLKDELSSVMSEVSMMISKVLDINNFFWVCAKSGAKKSEANMSNITGCYGQVFVENQRIKKKLDGRTSIYYHKDDDTPEARGFIKSSLITGMKGVESFFQSMQTREGFISTALNTATTGYIQRQFIKMMEDLVIKYDGTNRNSRGVITQLVYGENGINQSIQSEVTLNILSMNNKDIEEKISLSDKKIKDVEKKLKIKGLDKWAESYTNKVIQLRDTIRKSQANSLMNYKFIEEKYFIPVNLLRVTQGYSTNKELIDINPMEIDKAIEDFLSDYEYRIITVCGPNDKYMKENDRKLKLLFELALHQFLAPNRVLFEYGLTKEKFKQMMDDIKQLFIKAIVEPGEAVGIIAAQSVGEPTTQLALDLKKSAASGKKIGGVPRIQELMHYSKNIKNPQMIVYFDDSIKYDRSAVNRIVSYFKFLSIYELINTAQVYYDLMTNDSLSKKLKADKVSNPFFVNNQKADISSLPFVIRLVMNVEKMLDKETSLLDIKTHFISHWYKNFNNIKLMKKNEKEIFTKINRCAILSNDSTDKEQVIHIRFNMTNFNYELITEFLNIVLHNITLKGMENIDNVYTSQERAYKFEKDGSISDAKEWICYTDGINLEKLSLIKGIDLSRSKCNDINTNLRMYGIEATRQILFHEFYNTYAEAGSIINMNHFAVLVDQMCHIGEIISLDRHGMTKLDSDPIARASFEKQMEQFENAAIFNEVDQLKSVSSRVALGKVIASGTGMFELMIDTEKLVNSEYTQDETTGHITFLPLEEDGIINDVMKFGVPKADFFMPV